MNLYIAKTILARRTGMNTFQTIRIGSDMDLGNIVPLKNSKLWEQNFPGYSRLLELGRLHRVITDLTKFTHYLRQALEDEEFERPIENSWSQLYRFVALAIHCYLLNYTETIIYETSPVWHIGGVAERHNWINDTNITTRRIAQMLDESPILFLSS